ncbi:galectin-10-like isoform X1 [Pipistrellus kuhlii]|uniref:galectin-10-like isoform X1 n=1 Tax=Pipistrellus kuhlii TaxID=59472 RepID=UPI001E272F08|nr:galectin-10-like isoform X1 [Pipistrellus kuhlii]
MALLPVPYTKQACLSVGSFVKIKGTPAMPFSKDTQMQVDFHTGNEEDSDIAFHFRVYFGRRVVMNTRQGGKWGEEVKSTVMPFEDGQPFELAILVQPYGYEVTISTHALLSMVEKFLSSLTAIISPCCHSFSFHVSVNGREYYKFPHRLEPGHVRMIQVWREVSLTSVYVI